jgi:hypothetical protein
MQPFEKILYSAVKQQRLTTDYTAKKNHIEWVLLRKHDKVPDGSGDYHCT